MLLNYHIGCIVLQQWRSQRKFWCLVVCVGCDMFCCFVVASNVRLLILTIVTFCVLD